MDFKLFFGVVKRYKRIVIGGMVLAVVLSALSYGTPGLKGGMPTIIPRGSLVWEGNAELLISQAGYPYDRAVQQVIPGKGLTVPPETIGDLTYMSNLSSVYAAMANGTAVQNQVATETHVPLCALTLNATAGGPPTPSGAGCASVVANTVGQVGTGAPLPLITLTASAPTAAEAAKLATTTISVLRTKISQEQATAATPVDQRVELQTVMSGSPATLAQGYKKTVPILVLFAITAATIALAFILNNHSDAPVRSTRRRLDEGLDQYGGLASARNGHVAEPDYGGVHTGGGRMQLIGLRRGASATRLAEDEDEATQRAAAEESSATDGRRAWTERRPPHLLRGSGFESQSRD